MQFYSLPQSIGEVFGDDPQTRKANYHRIYDATLAGVVQPVKVGHVKLYTQSDIQTLREHFATKDAKTGGVK